MNTLITVVLFSVGLLSIALLGMCINIVIKKKGKFRSEHVGSSKALKDRGVSCAQTQDREARKNL